MKSETIKDELKVLTSKIRFNPLEYAPHLEIKEQVDAIQNKLTKLIDALKEENRTKFQIAPFNQMKRDLSHTMNKEYYYCTAAHRDMNKPRAAKKRKSEYTHYLVSLRSQIYRDVYSIDFSYERAFEEE